MIVQGGGFTLQGFQTHGAVNHAKRIPARAGWLSSLGNALVDDLDASGVLIPAGAKTKGAGHGDLRLCKIRCGLKP